MKRLIRLRPLGAMAVMTALAAINTNAQAQQAPPQVGLDLAAPVAPLNAITVPDVNVLGILDLRGPNAAAWRPIFGGGPITNRNQRIELQRLGKALFWDMQVGGDGIQSCASCHYHAGADNRITNQMSPGLKMTVGGPDVPASNSDTVHDLAGVGANGTLRPRNFNDDNVNGDPVGLPVNEAALINAGSTPDEIDGTSGEPGNKPNRLLDVNDVGSSQGVRLGTYEGLSGEPVDAATLAVDDPGFDGFTDFTVTRDAASTQTVRTVRRVEPRNSPTAVNAVYHMRNFWDGRADMFFDGVTPLGFRNPDSRVKVRSGANVIDQKLRIPFSSLASQAVGPIESDFEMVFTGRPHRDLGKKLLATGVVPLAGQEVSCRDSLLGGPAGCTVPGTTRGLTKNYKDWIKQVFHSRFWGTDGGADICLNAAGNLDDTCPANGYTLMEWNFSLFFGLAVQAYEATLTTEETIVDLLVGGIAEGQVVNQTTNNRGAIQQTVTVPVTGLPLEGCIAAAALNNSAAQQDVATALCTQHYAQWIHPRATAGSQANATATPVPAGRRIGGCSTNARSLTTEALNGAVTTAWCGRGALADVEDVVAAIDRGMGRFFAGATGCAICHFNPEFTGATVAALTGFGAAPPPPLPPGQLRRLPLEVPMERMIAFNGDPAVYDAGFYNLGVRPTPEDLSLGDQIGGVPLAFTKLAEQIQIFLAGGTVDGPYDGDKIEAIQDELASGTDLFIPTSATDLTPRPWTLALACGPGLVGNGNGNGNNNPNPQCVPEVIPGERLLRNGAFKAQGLRNVKFTGPYFHNGSKLNLSQAVNFYETAGSFPTLNLNNLDAGMREFDLGPTDTAALVEFMETGLTDWRLAHEQGKFDHPEICVPHGHDATGKTILVGIPAVGRGGNNRPLATFEDIVRSRGNHAHDLTDPCTVPGVVADGATGPAPSLIDVPPAP